MGYYTRYSLTVAAPEHDATIRQTFARVYYPPIPRSPFAEDRSSALLDGAVKWYSWREDCATVSAEHPVVPFTVEGEGEDGDRWRSTWLGGEETWVVLAPSIEVTP